MDSSKFVATHFDRVHRGSSPVYQRPKDDKSPRSILHEDVYGLDGVTLDDNAIDSQWMATLVDIGLGPSPIAITSTTPYTQISNFTVTNPSDPDSPDAKYRGTVDDHVDDKWMTDFIEDLTIAEPEVVNEVKGAEAVDVLQLFSKENVVEDIQSVFRYIKQLGSGI